MDTTSSYFREWIADGRVIACRLPVLDDATVDAWYEDMRQVFLTWNEERPMHVLVDISRPGSVSAQALTTARKLSNVRPDVPGRTAILVGRSLATPVMNMLIRAGLGGKTRQRRIFGTEAAALVWLVQHDPVSVISTSHPSGSS
jgi:hypothetical protein